MGRVGGTVKEFETNQSKAKTFETTEKIKMLLELLIFLHMMIWCLGK